MASFYSILSSQGDMLPTSYLLNQRLASYQSSELANNKDYANQPCVSLSYPDLLSGESTGSRDENVFIPPMTSIQQMDRHLNITPRYSDGNTVISDARAFSRESSFTQYHGLSLSLGSQEEPELAHMSSDMNQYTNSGLFSLLSSNMQSGIQNNENKNVQYLSFDLAGKTEDSVKAGTSNSFQNLIMPSPHHHQVQEIMGAFCNSKYLKAAQELLDELVSVRGASNQSGKGHKLNSVGPDVKNGVSYEIHESANDAPRDLSPSERHNLQNKVTKLLAMLDEVDRRYKQYCHQMQAVVSSFDMVTGRGAAQPYTMLALKTISRQFRCLRDAIKKQIEATQKSLGEQPDVNSHSPGVLSRLRYVDQQLRQQKALQQFGIMRQPWRPQRGLPESAVSVLRAWLFEHFLNPYPKDSEKIVLAKQTGLTRSQVANWFINARVRLWKPMIEEMYKEEFGDPETEPKSSSEHPTTNQEFSSLDDREEQFQGSLLSNVMRPDAISSLDGCRAELSYENVAFQGNEASFGLQNKQFLNVIGNSIFSDHPASPEKSTMIGNQVSLALGLQHSEKDSQRIDGEIESKGNDATSSSSMALDKLEYYYVDPVNNQRRFGNGHLLSDFVA